MNQTLPILYSFRRCPYAMRARMALAHATKTVELREVVLKNKPPQLLTISAKGTVPVLFLNNGTVIDESLDIMKWALFERDANNWLKKASINEIDRLIKWNDGEFKYYLDRYKYADRYPEHDEIYYRNKGELFLVELEKKLNTTNFLCSDEISFADIAIFPFIRQFAHVSIDWFKTSDYTKLNHWLQYHIDSALFISIMKKYPPWQADSDKLIVDFS